MQNVLVYYKSSRYLTPALFAFQHIFFLHKIVVLTAKQLITRLVLQHVAEIVQKPFPMH